jgi:hypothetical protein
MFGGFMTKKKSIQVCLSLFSLVLLLVILGCGSSSSNSSGGSSSGTGSQPAHGQATINLMEQNVFNGANLNTAYWTQLEAFCNAGPTQLIIADMALVPDQMSRSGFTGSWGVQMYALSSTYAGVFVSTFGIGELEWFLENQDQVYAWWDRYISAIRNILQKYPQTTVLIIINDEPDKCGARLGLAIQSNLASFGNRVALGDVLYEWAKIKRIK